MKIQVRQILSGFSVLVAFAAILSGVAFAAAPVSAMSARSQSLDDRLRVTVADSSSDDVSKASFAGAVITNSHVYQAGKNFAFAISDAQKMDQDDGSFNYTIVDLVYLIDDLEGQPEAAQLQSILKAVVRGTKRSAQVSSEIVSISKSYLARQNAEQKWYYNVGHSQVNLMISSWANDAAGIKTNLNDLQALRRNAPQGTPKSIVDAISGLSKYSAKPTFTKEDCTALVNDVKVITNAVYA